MSTSVTRGVFHALVDADDRVLSGDARFVELNDRAGGVVGAELALATVGALVRIARGLRVPVARTITIGDDRSDTDWHVRAVPGDDRTVALAATLLRERPMAPVVPGAIVEIVPPTDAAWTWEVDAALIVTRIDAASIARVGLDPVTIVGQPLAGLFVLEADAGGAMPLLEALSRAQDFTGQQAILRATGMPVTLAGHVRHDAAGGFAGFVGGVLAVPVTGGGAISDFNTRLHRMLRAPLRTIVAQAENIRAAADGPVDAEYVDYAADIATAGRHLMGLVDDLVDIEAIERMDFTTARDRIDLADVAREAAVLLAVAAAARGVTIVSRTGKEPASAIGEHRRALQIVVNLLGNAVTYSPEGGTVDMRLEAGGGQVRLLVYDRGQGVPAHEQARIFEKFVRGDGSAPDGNGLGLYIARRLAQAMDGALTVESVSGEGACFTLSLPAAP